MKLIVLASALSMLIFICIPLFSQSDAELHKIVLQDVFQRIDKESLSGPDYISTERLLCRNAVKSNITQAIVNKDTGLAKQYFELYSEVLDTLVITNPITSLEIVYDLKNLYKDNPYCQERLAYYSSSVEYYLGFYEEAESALTEFQNKYPESPLSSVSFTLQLKTLISLDREEDAYQLLLKRIGTLDDEQNYLAGHICFAINKDTEAETYFNKVTNITFKREASRMLVLLSALKQEPGKAKILIEELLQNDPSNPFLLLNLARLSSLDGKWQEAEQFYSQYIPAIKKHKDMTAQYELATAYLNSGNTASATEILDNAMNNRDLGEYAGQFLYLWAETAVSDNQAELAQLRTTNIRNIVRDNRAILAEKIRLIDRISSLKETAGRKSDPKFISTTLDETEIITSKLDSLNHVLSQNYYGIAFDELARWQALEKQIALSFLEQLSYYIAADRINNISDKGNMQQLQSVEAIYNEHNQRISQIKQSILNLNYKNNYLALRNEVDNSIATLDKILQNLLDKKHSRDPKYSSEQLDSLIIATERKKAETEMLLDYYDYDNTLYKEVLAECEASDIASKELLKDITTLKKELGIQYSKYVSSKEKKVITRDIAQLPLLIPQYVNLLTDYQEFLKIFEIHLEYIGYHISYLETSFYDKDRKHKEAVLSFEESQKLFNENMLRKQTIRNQIETFTLRYANKTLELKLPNSYNINIMADAYFTLAEISNSLEPDKPQTALSLYRKTLELEPVFHMADAVLYNIGYLSSNIVKNRIQAGIEIFETKKPGGIRPDSLRLTESTLREAIFSYKRLAAEFKESQYFSETLYRLGYLYFDIGTDAAVPVDYYKIARTYYNILINRDNDPYNYKALYQRGWTWLNSGSEAAYINAINDFTTILNAIDSLQITDEVEIIDYSIAARKNIGYCLVSLDGTDYDIGSRGVKYAKENLGARIKNDDLLPIIDEAIRLKLSLYLPIQAIDYMNYKMDSDPLAVENPVIADSICSLYKSYPKLIRTRLTPDKVYIAEREKILSRFSYKSDWYNANKDKDITRQLQIITNAFSDVEKRYNNEFYDNPTVENFEKYINLVNRYSDFQGLHLIAVKPDFQWNEQIEANIIAQNIKLARSSNNPAHYLVLADRIYDFNDRYPDNSSYLNLEETAYDCARIVVDSLKIEIAEYKEKNKQVIIPFGAETSTGYYQQAAQRFLDAISSPKFKPELNDNLFVSILLRQAEYSREKGQPILSATFFKEVTDYEGKVEPAIKRTAYINLAELAESDHKYEESEHYYKMAEVYALDKKDRETLHQYTLMQIQNSIDKARKNGSYSIAAKEYLRLAGEFDDINVQLQYKAKAQKAYLGAGEYQKSIDLLLDIAKSQISATQAQNFYLLARSLADSVGFDEQSREIRDSFINQYPASNEAYELRLGIIDELVSKPSSAGQAGTMYLELYNDVVNNRIDPGKDDPAELYLASIGMFDKAGDAGQQETMAKDFIVLYPQHLSTIVLMEFLADIELERGNKTGFEKFARSAFIKDKTHNTRYSNIAKDNLGKIAAQFTKAYSEKNWQDVNKNMEEFTKTHNAYESEGLKLDFKTVYDAFRVAGIEYKEIQARNDFIKQFREILKSTEMGTLSQGAEKLIRVNLYTKWKRHMVGGEQRIQAAKNSTDKEIAKIKKALEEGADYNLDVNDRLKAFDLICRISEHGSDVVKTQIEKYMKVSVEFDNYKKQYRGNIDELYKAFAAQKEGHAMAFLQDAYPYYLAMYKYFYLPGIKNQFTTRAYERLIALDALPQYRLEYLNLESNLTASLINTENHSVVTNLEVSSYIHLMPDSSNYYKVVIPAHSEIVIHKTINSPEHIEYTIADVIAANPADIEITLNEVVIDYTSIPFDLAKSVERGIERNILVFGESKFISDTNILELRLPNYTNEIQNFHLKIMMMSDLTKTGESQQTN
jgi:tetratricopeptide (TPR) repeat protein